MFAANSSTTISAGNPWLAEGFDYIAPAAGTYFVRVRGATGVTGTYHLLVAACALPTPAVSIAAGSGTGLIVSWPAGFGAFQLQSSPDMRSWTDIGPTLPAPEDDGRIKVAVPAAGPAKFFRLAPAP